MPESVKKTKCGEGCCEKNWGGYAGEGKEEKMRGWGVRKKFEGVCRRGLRRQKVGVLRETIEGGGYAGEGKEDEMGGLRKQFEGGWGVCRRGLRRQNLRGVWCVAEKN